MPPIDKPIPRDTGTPNSRLDNFTPTEQWQYIWSDTNRYNLSSATLWGIFGVASNYGQSYKELADGAAGPFQIKLRIWDVYSHQLGYGTHDIQDFMKSADVVCVALQSLGADANPTSKKTIGALNLFHATGGGENVTPYVQSVWKKGNTAVPGGGKPAAGATTGVTPNATTPFQAPWHVGDVQNSHEDIWTGVNRLSQSAQWYLFSSGEILYVADGYQLMAQAPAAFIDRWDEHDANSANPRILQCNMTYDNTAFEYVTTHKRRGKVQRKSTLAKATSPTEITIDWICNIDAIRAGDIVYLANFGMATGAWLVGDCTRSIFSIYSSLQLVSAMMPINANTTIETGSGGAGGTTTGGTVNKSGLTVGGAAMTQAQANLAGQLISIGNGLKATTLGLQAIIFAAIVESGMSVTADNGTYWGVLSGSHTNFPNKGDVTGMATSFFKGGRGFTSCLTLEANHPNASLVDLATAVEGAYNSPGATAFGDASQYTVREPTQTAHATTEAPAIVAAYQAPVSSGGGLHSLAPGISASAIGDGWLARGGEHHGVDISMSGGTGLHAICDGTISNEVSGWSASEAGSGSWGPGTADIVLKSSVGVPGFPAGTYFGYGHSDKHVKHVGDKVKGGDLIAYSGCPSGGCHCHFFVNTSTGSGDGNTDPEPIAIASLNVGH